MSFDIITLAPGAPVATDGTMTFPYPGGHDDDNYFPTTSGATMWVEAHETLYAQGGSGFTLAYGESSVVATYKGSTTIPAGTPVSLQIPLKNFAINADPDNAVAHIAPLTEDSGAIAGSNDGDLPDLTATAIALDPAAGTPDNEGDLADVTDADQDNNNATIAAQFNALLADVAALRAAVRELAERSNEHNTVFITTDIMASS